MLSEWRQESRRRGAGALLLALTVLVSLCGCGGMSRREKLVKEATTAEEARDRIDALGDLARLKEPLVSEEIQTILTSDPNAAARGVAAAKLAERGDRQAVGPLKKTFETDDNAVVRVACLDAVRKLGALKEPAISQMMVDGLMNDPSGMVRVECARLLRYPKYPPALPALIAALDDYDPAVKVIACRTLVKLTRKKDLPPVRADWQMAMKDELEKLEAPPK